MLDVKRIADVMKDNHHPMEDLEKIHKDVVDAAYEIIEKKRATYYGIGMALNRLVKAILNNENSILNSIYLFKRWTIWTRRYLYWCSSNHK